VNYALLIYDDDSTWADLPDEERATLRAAEMPKWNALFEELGRADPNVSGKELDSRTTAKVVRVRDGESIVTDGDPRRGVLHRARRSRRGHSARRADSCGRANRGHRD
jgi:hypothetical protein